MQVHENFDKVGRLAAHVLLCACAVLASIWLSFLLRFDFQVPASRVDAAWLYSIVAVPLQTGTLLILGWRRFGWTAISLPDLRFLARIVLTAAPASAVFLLAIPNNHIPRSVYVLQTAILLLISIAVRLVVRLRREALRAGTDSAQRKRALIYGAGLGGQALLRELRQSPQLGYEAVGFVDDCRALKNTLVQGLPVLSNGPGLCTAVGRNPVDEILVAIPSASAATLNQIRTWCDQAGRPCKTIPGLGELLSRPERVTDLRQISFEELLGRQQVQLDEKAIRELVGGQVVLVTGAAGSIGSELCRQLVTFSPAKIVAVDVAETPLFELENHLREHLGSVPCVPVLMDVRNESGLAALMRRFRVDCVLHAAAYKHVPMMERHPAMAVSNNVFGTLSAARAAEAAGVSRFVMISTDKAVRPSSVMGATKRVAEMVVKSRRGGRTRFVSVRFGNVLGSNGSVVPIFKRQISSGGPVTVTHPEMRRYFMTIPEASRLVLQAMTMGTANEIFVLDMGEPVRIDHLARNLIALSGLRPDRDIRIAYTGLRPGEKLFEELYLGDENLVRTVHEKILVLRGPELERDRIDSEIEKLRLLIEKDQSALVHQLHQLVPDFVSPTLVPAGEDSGGGIRQIVGGDSVIGPLVLDRNSIDAMEVA